MPSKHKHQRKRKSKSKSKHSSRNKKNSQHHKHKPIMQNEQRLLNLIHSINDTRRGLTKSQTNLPARLMSLSSTKPQSQHYSKSVSSSYSSVMHNGHMHSQGKEIVNESSKPYLAVKEMHNGHVNSFMIPKKSIPYQQPKLFTMLETPSTLLHSKTTRKHKTAGKTKRSKRSKKTKKSKHTKKH
jgi:hypothetical protein